MSGRYILSNKRRQPGENLRAYVVSPVKNSEHTSSARWKSPNIRRQPIRVRWADQVCSAQDFELHRSQNFAKTTHGSGPNSTNPTHQSTKLMRQSLNKQFPPTTSKNFESPKNQLRKKNCRIQEGEATNSRGRQDLVGGRKQRIQDGGWRSQHTFVQPRGRQESFSRAKRQWQWGSAESNGYVVVHVDVF